MADCILMQAGGGGLDPDELTATAGDVLKGMLAGVKGYDDPVRGTLELTGTAADSQVLNGQTYYNTDAKTKRTGGMPNRGAWTGRIGVNGKMAIPAGYHNGAGYVDQAINNRGAWNSRIGINGKVAIPEGYHNGSGYVDQAVTNRGAWTGSVGRNGRIVVPEGYHNGTGYVNGPSLTDKGAATYTPGRSNQTIGAGHYLTGAQTILGDANLLPQNIRDGITIFGMRGNFQGAAVSPYAVFKAKAGSAQPDNVVIDNTGGTTQMVASGICSASFITIDKNNCWQMVLSSNQGMNSRGNITIHRRVNNSVNLSNHRYLRLKYTKGSGFGGMIGVGVSANASTTSYTSLATATAADGQIILDISNLSGNYFIYFYVDGLSKGANAIITDVLEIFGIELTSQ